MNKEELIKAIEEAKKRLKESFKNMLESSNQEDVKEYDKLSKIIKDLQEQLKDLEEKEREDEANNQRNQNVNNPTPSNTPQPAPMNERVQFVRDLREAISLGNRFTGVLPREVATEIQRRKAEIAQLRGLCSVHTATGEYTVYVEGDAATVSYVGENAAIGETSPTIEPIALKALKLAAISRISNEFLNDVGVDVMAYLIDVIAKAFADMEDKEILFGAGTASSQSALRGIAGNAGTKLTTASETAITWPEVKNVINSLKDYQGTATLVMAQSTLNAISEFKDGSSYIFPQNAAITQIMGVPVKVCSAMPSLAAGKTVIIAGDFKYYHLLDRQSLEMVTLNERYAEYDQTGIRAIERIDGDLVPEAFVALTMKATTK